MQLVVGWIGQGLSFSAEAKISGREIFGFSPAKEKKKKIGDMTLQGAAKEEGGSPNPSTT